MSTLTSSELQADHPGHLLLMFGTLSCTEMHSVVAENLTLFRCRTFQTCHRMPQYPFRPNTDCGTAPSPPLVHSLEVCCAVRITVCFECVTHMGCLCRAVDYWEGYKLLCFAYYSHSVQHETEFRQSKLGSCFLFHVWFFAMNLSILGAVPPS